MTAGAALGRVVSRRPCKICAWRRLSGRGHRQQETRAGGQQSWPPASISSGALSET